jgi:NADH-quinone oxidoreductase subunit G
LGSENIDFRLRQTDASLDAALTGTPWLGFPVAELDSLDRVLIVGSFLRKDHPLMAQRLRQAAKRGTQISLIDIAGDDPLIKLTARATVLPTDLSQTVAQVAVALSKLKAQEVPASLASIQSDAVSQAMAQSLASGERVAILLGNTAVNAPDASSIAANAQLIAQLSGGQFGFLTAGANTVGGYLAGAVPTKGGKAAAAMLSQPLKAYVVLHAEPLLDADNGAQAVATLQAAEFVVALTPYASGARDWANVMLPVAPFTETSGTFVNAQGTAQSFKGTAAARGESRPAWKVLRVLGNVLHLAGFDDESSETVRDTVLANGVDARLSNQIQVAPSIASHSAQGLQRVTDVPIYRSDAIVRRAPALQATHSSRTPVARMHEQTLSSLGVMAGQQVRVKSATGQVTLTAELDNTLVFSAVRISAAFEQTAALGSAFGQLQVERA